MKALTVCQPWAHLIVHGNKRIENRTWHTDYLGWLLIHAGKRPVNADHFVPRSPLIYLDARWGPLDLPGIETPAQLDFGAIIGAAFLDVCFTMLSWRDFALNYAEGPHCWRFTHVISLASCGLPPLPFRGRQRLFDVDDRLLPTEFIKRLAAISPEGLTP